jgi:tetratricopeptide (TPR) repeat protein/DNA-binding SARP family transcriptional activator
VVSETSAGPEVRLLGSVQMWAGGRRIDIGPAKQRCVLAALAWEAGTVVSAEVLIDRVWGADPSGNVLAVLRTYIARLRRVLAAVPDVGDQLLRRDQSGYVLGLGRGQVDALRFQDLVGRARRQPNGIPDVHQIREALSMWRGTPLVGLSGDWVDGVRAGLDTLRQGAMCDRIDGDLRDGASAGLVDELTGLVAEYPLNESMAALLMRALFAEGRRAEALDSFQRLRRRLVDELGVGPGEEADSLHQLMLRGEHVEAAAEPAPSEVSLPMPRQLPAAPATFVGRDAELGAVTRRLESGSADGQSTTVVAIHGTGGVGKSALALRAAHAVADHFPDGQLYVDLQGSSPGMQPLSTTDALGRFLRATGRPSAVPDDLDEAAALLRSTVAGRRVLVVLDNAASTAQTRPLLPGAGECAVIVTSRSMMAGLDSATQVALDLFGPDEAVALLRELAPTARLDTDRDAVAELAELCSYLPLALRVLASRIASRPSWPVREFVDRLRNEKRRLDQLGHGDVSMRGCFEVSHEVLAASDDPVDDAAARCFPLLGLPTGPDISLPVAARLFDLDESEADEVLDRLVDLHLLESPLPGRFRMHDLLRLYARDLAETQLSDADRLAALHRSWQVYAATAERASELLRPGYFPELNGPLENALPLSSVDQATRWMNEERANLLAAIEQAAGAPGEGAAMTVRLVRTMFHVMTDTDVQGLHHISRLALEAARNLGDRQAEARALSDLSVAYFILGQVDDAVAHQQRALDLRRVLGRRSDIAVSLHNLGVMLKELGDPEAALQHHEEALEIRRALGESAREANTLGVLAEANLELGNEAVAHAQLQESLAKYRQVGDVVGMAETLRSLGEILLARGETGEAIAHLGEVLELNRELRLDAAVARTLVFLGEAHRRMGERDQAIECLEDAVTLARDVRDPGEEGRALKRLGDTWADAGDPERARGCWNAALPLLERFRHPDATEVRSRLDDDPR